MADFFISYNKADRSWAEWIARQLEHAGYSTALQAWDFRPGSNFVVEMQKASADCSRTIAVLSPDYLSAQFTQPEWAAAFAKDPAGNSRTLVPVRVGDCSLEAYFPQISKVISRHSVAPGHRRVTPCAPCTRGRVARRSPAGAAAI